MYDVSAEWRREIRNSHRSISKVEARRGDSLSVLQVIDATTVADYDSTTRRGLDLTLIDPANGMFDDMESVLDPFIVRLTPFRGVRFASGVEEIVPFGEMFITELEAVEKDGAPSWRVTAFDASVRCQDEMGFPFGIANATPINEVVPPLLQTQFGSMQFRLPSSDFVTPALVLTEDRNPWEEARKLEESQGFDLAMGRDGICTATSRVVSTAAEYVWHFEEGVNSDKWGTGRSLRNDTRHPNVVVVLGTNANAPGVSGFAADQDPYSRTYWNGPNGRHIRMIRSERVMSSEQATAMAGAVLGKLLGPQDEVSFEAAPNAALDVGDTVAITRAKMGLNKQRMIVKRIECPVNVAAGSMSVTCSRGVFTDIESARIRS